MRNLTTTQAVVLDTMYDDLMVDGWSSQQLAREIPGVRFNVRTLDRLDDLGLINRPSRDHSGWLITDTGKMWIDEARMNADSRISGGHTNKKGTLAHDQIERRVHLIQSFALKHSSKAVYRAAGELWGHIDPTR